MENNVSVAADAAAAPVVPAEAGTEIHESGGQSSPPKSEQEEKFKVRSNGRTIFLTREELIQRAELADGAYSKFEEAKKLREDANRIQKRFKDDPEGFYDYLIELGHEPEKVRAAIEKKYKEKFLDPEMLTPEQRELEELRKFRSERQKEEEKRSEDERLKALEQEEHQELQNAQRIVTEALDKTGLKKDLFNIGRCAAWYKALLAKGIDPTPERVAMKVREEQDNIHTSKIEQCASAEEYMESLPESVRQKVVQWVREHDLAQWRKGRMQPEQPQTSKPKKERKQVKTKHISAFDVWDD